MAELTSWSSAEGTPVPQSFFSVYQQIQGKKEKETSLLLSDQHPYFRQVSTRVWVIPDRGRIAAFLHPVYNQIYWGYFECVDKTAVSNKLFESVACWAQKEGIDRLSGPVNFNTFLSYRWKTDEGFTGFPGEPDQPGYYPELAEHAGYIVARKYYSQLLNLRQLEKLSLDFKRVPDDTGDLLIKPLTRSFWQQNLKSFYRLVLRIFGNSYGFIPIDYPTFRYYYENLNSLCEHTSLYAVNPEGKPVAFILTFRDVNRPYRLLIKTVGILQEYQQKKLFLPMAKKGFPNLLTHYREAVACLIREDNNSGSFLQHLHPSVSRYSLYTKAL
jgi:hypothetical protein